MPGLFDRLQGEIESREKAAGLSMADILDLPDPLRRVVNWMMKEGEVSFSQVAAFIAEEETRRILNTLVEKGFVRELAVQPESRFKVRLARKRKKEIPLNLWDALGDKTE